VPFAIYGQTFRHSHTTGPSVSTHSNPDCARVKLVGPAAVVRLSEREHGNLNKVRHGGTEKGSLTRCKGGRRTRTRENPSALDCTHAESPPDPLTRFVSLNLKATAGPVPEVGLAPECLDSTKTVLGLIRFLLSLVLSWYCLGTCQAMAWKTKGRRCDSRNRAGYALTRQYLGGRPLNWLSPAHFRTFGYSASGQTGIAGIPCLARNRIDTIHSSL